MDVIKILKLISITATLIGTAANYIAKPKLDAANDEKLRLLVEKAVENAFKHEKGL